MASVSDIRTKPKYFVRKKNCDANKLCDVCKSHEIIIAVKWGCDFVLTTDITAKSKSELKNKLHVWCESDEGKSEGSPPTCFGEYKDSGYCTT